MKAYLNIVNDIINNGIISDNRTGIKSISIPGMMFRHDMIEGFPLLTTKKMPFHLIASELEFFIKGLTDKQWLKDRNNHIWDEWCNPEKVPYSHDPKIQKEMAEENDLGPIYGWQWRHFGARYINHKTSYSSCGIDQLQNLIDGIKADPNDRRLIVTAWNPSDVCRMALPPCHHTFQVLIKNEKLNLIWSQRSGDSILGLPFNIASYGLLLHLLAEETDYRPGTLIGFLHDTHVYVNHIKTYKDIQSIRNPVDLPILRTSKFTSIFDWKYTDSEIICYHPHDPIKYEIAI